MENNQIDQLFKEKLGNFEQNPPVGLLDEINRQVAFRSRVRRINQIKTIIGIAAALVLVLMAGWFTVNTDELSENKSPLQIHQQISPVQHDTKQVPAVTSKADNRLLVYQHNSGQTTENKQIRQTNKIHVQKKSTTGSSALAANEVGALQTIGQEPATNTQSSAESTKGSPNKNPSALKEETKISSKPNKQRGGEPLYFADSQFNPNVAVNTSEKGSWTIKAEISPMFAPQNQVGTSNGTTGTKSKSTISGGMLASYKLSKRVSISSGIRFSQMKQGTHSDYYLSAKSGITYLQPVEKNANISADVSLYLPSVSSIVYSNGMQASANNTFKSDISQEFKYLEIPILATYKLIDAKVSLGVTGGFSTNILVGNVASITENGIKLSQGNTNNLRDIIYSGSAGIELGYDLGKNLMLTIEPRVKQYMHSVSSNDLIDFKPLQLGIFTGITYSFY